MMWISIDFATDLAEVLDDGPPSHSDSDHSGNLEPFSCTDRFGKVRVCSFQEFVVLAAQVYFEHQNAGSAIC